MSEEISATRNGDEQNHYDLPVELFAGTVVTTMGILVVLTPLIANMPRDYVWNPVLMDLLSGAIYIVIGIYLLIRSRRS